VDFIQQDAPTLWKTFILDKSTGFTLPGVVRLNDSIRTYVWAILGAQAQTRAGILRLQGNTTAFDAQKQFLANVEDAISSPVDLPAAVVRYQDVLQYAGSQVDFIFGFGLYMAPSDMQLQIGRVAGYNNEIIIATAEGLTLGRNAGLNAERIVPISTGETGVVHPMNALPTTPPTIVAQVEPVLRAEAEQHDDEKTALIVGGIVVGLLVLFFLR
jgi:hypothetical protein